jgi:hypothetical protein
MAVTLSEILSAGYVEIGRKPQQRRVIDKPVLALGEVEALIAWCSAELDRHYDHDRDIRNCPDAMTAMDDAAQQLSGACDSLGSALGYLERDREYGRAAE